MPQYISTPDNSLHATAEEGYAFLTTRDPKSGFFSRVEIHLKEADPGEEAGWVLNTHPLVDYNYCALREFGKDGGVQAFWEDELAEATLDDPTELPRLETEEIRLTVVLIPKQSDSLDPTGDIYLLPPDGYVYAIRVEFVSERISIEFYVSVTHEYPSGDVNWVVYSERDELRSFCQEDE